MPTGTEFDGVRRKQQGSETKQWTSISCQQKLPSLLMAESCRAPRRRTANSKNRDDYYDISNYDQNDIVADHGMSWGEDGSMTRQYAPSIRPRKQRITPASLDDDEYANWKPFHGVSSKSPHARTTQDCDADSDDDDADPSDDTGEALAGKRKRYTSSDDPNCVWRPYAIELLHELYRFDGLGDALVAPCCSACGTIFKDVPRGGTTPTRLFCCQDCSPLLECKECCLERHRVLPLHIIKEWVDTHYTRISLCELGLVYQLGHSGLPCLLPEPKDRRMVVLDCNGIHRITVRYCECASIHRASNIQQLMRAGWYPATITDPKTCATFKALDYSRELKVRANVNTTDFIDTLLGLTDPIDTDQLPDRRKTFSRMARQWVLLHHLKRSGVGIDLRCLDDIAEGSLAMLCWACPHPDINLPRRWKTVDPKFFYLYMPIVAIDANFQLKNRYRPNERPSPELAPGSAYFVNPTEYKDFLKDYVSEQDISTCIAFAALLEKDTKLTTGLKTSGVAGCACARHELVLPQGMGDLQKGERYANMDFVFFSAVKGIQTKHLAVSYDIACQWQQNFWQRMTRLPEALHLDQEHITLTFGLPTWHAAAHELSCRTANSLTYQDGLGRTDGEGIERIWSVLNTASYATKEMGEGLRHDTLDDRIDHHNFKKNLGLGKTLARRLRIAIEARDEQYLNFQNNDRTLKPTLRVEWKKQIDDWNADRSLPSPYLLTGASKGPSEEEVRSQLKAEDKAAKKRLRTPIHRASAGEFIGAGLKLEDLQSQIRRESKAATTPHQRAQVDNHRDEFFNMLEAFRQLQELYTPGALPAMEVVEANRLPNSPLDDAENMKLWLPSDFSTDERVTSCTASVPEQEARLRKARCNDALVAVRHYLHAKQYLLAFRNANVTGQNESTRARGIIDTTGEQVQTEAEKYRRSRQALLSLRNVPSLDDYPELTQEDVTLDVVTDPDLLAIAKLGKAGSQSHRRPHISMGRKTVSWIWTAQGGPTEEETSAVNESARIEWSKSLARRNRWVEEVTRLREEMKFTLRFLKWRIACWKSTMPAIDEKRPHHPATAITAGVRSYAFRQISYLEHILAGFRAEWGTGAEDTEE